MHMLIYLSMGIMYLCWLDLEICKTVSVDWNSQSAGRFLRARFPTRIRLSDSALEGKVSG